jgi:hypothetical protein
MKVNTSPILLALLLAFFGFLSEARAVNPPPDGGYPNLTTAEGQNALFSLSTGSANTAVGWLSLRSVTTGSFNTGVGAATLVLNTGDDNTATGAAALLLNTTGANNTANGTATLVHNSTGSDNTAVGAFALNSNTASGNTAIGSNALLSNTTGGTLGNTKGFDVGPNVAVGSQALQSNITSSANTAVGYQALGSITTGVQDTDVGASTAVGFQALANATSPGAGANNAFGYQALFNLTEGLNNVAVGFQALRASTTAGGNVAVGNGAGIDITSGSNNVCIGTGAGTIITESNNVICIGTNVAGANVENSCYIGNIWTQPGGTQAVYVNSEGKLGAQVSSRRFKDEIKPMEQASEIIYALKPVSFRYKKEIDPAGAGQFGLVAEDVENVNPDLVIRDKDGKPYSVRYDQVNAMLLNEFLKEHNAVQELKSTVREQATVIAQQRKSFESKLGEQEKQIEALTAGLQKVNAQLEMDKSAPRVAANAR